MGLSGGLLENGGAVSFMPVGVVQQFACVMNYTAVVGGANWSIVGNAGTMPFLQNASQNDEVSWPVVLVPGTYTMTVLCRKSNTFGIAACKLDGASIGTMDFYNASSIYASPTITSIAVTSGGVHTLDFALTTKNGSSTGFATSLNTISFVRTA